MSTALDPFEQALRVELHGVTPPDAVGVAVGDVLAGGRRTRTRRRLAAGISALVVVALVVLGTALHGAREEAVPATPLTPTGLTLLTPPEGEVAPSYGVTVGTGSPAAPSSAAATTATVWSHASGRWARVLDVALDPRHVRSAWVVVPRSSVLIGFVPSSAAQRAAVWREGADGLASRPETSAVADSSWSAFVTVPQWTTSTPTESAAPTDLVWWSSDRVPVDADGRRGTAVTVDGVPLWMDARERLWGIQADTFNTLPVGVGDTTGVGGGPGPAGQSQTDVALLPADVPLGPVTALWTSGRRTHGTVASLGSVRVVVATDTASDDDQPSRIEWTGVDGRTGSYRLL